VNPNNIFEPEPLNKSAVLFLEVFRLRLLPPVSLTIDSFSEKTDGNEMSDN
jgi:hypothetical protein